LRETFAAHQAHPLQGVGFPTGADFVDEFLEIRTRQVPRFFGCPKSRAGFDLTSEQSRTTFPIESSRVETRRHIQRTARSVVGPPAASGGTDGRFGLDGIRLSTVCRHPWIATFKNISRSWRAFLPAQNAAAFGRPYNGLHGSSSTKRQNGREAVTQSQGSADASADRPAAERVIAFRSPTLRTQSG
jgi:hypothetical protein